MSATLEQLRVARSFLCQSRLLVNGVGSLFSNTDKDAAERLRDIERYLSDEMEFVDRLISQPEALKH